MNRSQLWHGGSTRSGCGSCAAVKAYSTPFGRGRSRNGYQIRDSLVLLKRSTTSSAKKRRQPQQGADSQLLFTATVNFVPTQGRGETCLTTCHKVWSQDCRTRET